MGPTRQKEHSSSQLPLSITVSDVLNCFVGYSFLLDVAASVVLPDGRHRHQVLRDLQMVEGCARVETVLPLWCIKQKYGHSIAGTEALKLSNLPSLGNSIVRHDYIFVTVVKFAINSGAQCSI